MKYFGTSGIRRIADADFLILAQKCGFAIGTKYKRIIIGTDTRTSNEAMKYAVLSGLMACGAECHDAGVIPTPTLAKAGKEFDCSIMITASHNPPEYNGIKLLNPDGSPFNNNQQQEIEDLIDNPVLPTIDFKNYSHVTHYTTAVSEHIKEIRKQVPGEFPTLKVVLDPDCGAGTSITERLLRDMGVELTVINGKPNGVFPRPAEPMPENLTMLCEKVKEVGADLGIAHDGDADRVMAVDDLGRPIPGEKLLLMFASLMNTDAIVTTVDASMAVEESNYKISRSAVGDNCVTDLMIKDGIAFGGEPSGSWIFKDMSYCPDGIYGAALLVKLASEHKLSEWADSMPEYPILRNSIKGSFDFKKIQKLLTTIFADATLSTVDGLRYEIYKGWDKEGWILVRKSGTEPKIRFTVEAYTLDKAQEFLDIAMTTIQGLG